jgi:hypothetical protein
VKRLKIANPIHLLGCGRGRHGTNTIATPVRQALVGIASG